MEKQKKNPKSDKSVEIPKTEASKELEAKTRSYILIIGLAVVFAVLVGGFIIYWLAGRFVLQSNLNKAQDQLISDLIEKQKDLQELKPNFEKINTKGTNGVSDAELILRAVPTTQDYESLIAILERMGQESGVKVRDISQQNVTQTGQASVAPVPPPTNTNIQTAGATPYVFTVKLEGSYNSILEFLKKTENSARVINFNSMDIDGNTNNITANLTMTTYFKPDANIESTFVPLK